MTNEELINLLMEANSNEVTKTAQRLSMSDVDTEQLGKAIADAVIRNLSKKADNVNPIVTTDPGETAVEPNPAAGEPGGIEEDELSDLLEQFSTDADTVANKSQAKGNVRLKNEEVDTEKVIEETAKKILSEKIVDDPEAAAAIAEAIVVPPMEKIAEQFYHLGRLYFLRELGII